MGEEKIHKKTERAVTTWKAESDIIDPIDKTVNKTSLEPETGKEMLKITIW